MRQEMEKKGGMKDYSTSCDVGNIMLCRGKKTKEKQREMRKRQRERLGAVVFHFGNVTRETLSLHHVSLYFIGKKVG